MCRATHPPTTTALGDIMGRSLRLLAGLALGAALAGLPVVAAAAQPSQPTVEDQNDRRLRSLRVEQAERTQAGVERFWSGERNFAPDPDIVGDVVAPSRARPVPAVPRPGVGVAASLLLGLVGGVVGGCAVLVGWAITTRRRLRQPATAT
jgi:hypothetical protein